MTKERQMASTKRGKIQQSTYAWQGFMLGFYDGIDSAWTF